MFPKQSSNIGQWVIGLVGVIYLVNNPQSAARLVNQVVAAISTFANSLGT